MNSTYHAKNQDYFGNPRADYVAVLPTNSAAAILELGCGNGVTGALALRHEKCAHYVGIELFEPMARQAAEVLTQVHIGNVETMDLPYEENSFDGLIMSEVLEHLVEPDVVVARLVRLVKPGGLVFASSPNISHWKIISQLMLGRFQYQDEGVMDRTHLHWFTPKTFRNMFDAAGVIVDKLGPLAEVSKPKRRLLGLAGRRFSHLSWGQINLHGHRMLDGRQSSDRVATEN